MARSANLTPYGQTVEDHDVALRIIEELEHSSQYRERRRDIEAFNRHSPILKRGIALTPVKFGISFTLTPLNKAGALVHVYQDGSLHLNHGGTEMGQGLFQKVAQIAAEELGIGLERVQHHGDVDRQGAEYLGDRRVVRHRFERHGRLAGRARDQGAPGALRGRGMERFRGTCLVPRRPRVHRQ